MNNEIKKALSTIKAEEALKEKTKAYIKEITAGEIKTKSKHSKLKAVSLIAACLAICFISLYSTYFTATAQISLDTTPAVELSLNRFDRVLYCKSNTDQGDEFLKGLKLKHLSCEEALESIIKNQTDSLFTNEQELEITVDGKNEKQCKRLLYQARECERKHKENCREEESTSYSQYNTTHHKGNGNGSSNANGHQHGKTENRE